MWVDGTKINIGILIIICVLLCLTRVWSKEKHAFSNKTAIQQPWSENLQLVKKWKFIVQRRHKKKNVLLSTVCHYVLKQIVKNWLLSTKIKTFARSHALFWSLVFQRVGNVPVLYPYTQRVRAACWKRIPMRWKTIKPVRLGPENTLGSVFSRIVEMYKSLCVDKPGVLPNRKKMEPTMERPKTVYKSDCRFFVVNCLLNSLRGFASCTWSPWVVERLTRFCEVMLLLLGFSDDIRSLESERDILERNTGFDLHRFHICSTPTAEQKIFQAHQVKICS